MDVVNNVIIVVRVAPSNAYLIAGLKSPILVFGSHYDMLFYSAHLFPSFFYPNVAGSETSVVDVLVFAGRTFRALDVTFFPTPQLCLLWSWFSQDYFVDAQLHALRNKTVLHLSCEPASELRICWRTSFKAGSALPLLS